MYLYDMPAGVDEGEKGRSLLAIRNTNHEPQWRSGRRACHVTWDQKDNYGRSEKEKKGEYHEWGRYLTC